MMHTGVTPFSDPQHQGGGGDGPSPLRAGDLDYALPEELIATVPVRPRDAARMMVVTIDPPAVEHRFVRDLPQFIGTGDLMVFNTTAVHPARLVARRADSGGQVEGLFVELTADEQWRVLLRSNGRLRVGQRLVLLDRDEGPSPHVLVLTARAGDGWIVAPDPAATVDVVLSAVGRTPLPPYIRRARGTRSVADADDQSWYQTVYADPARRQSVAAPTAGLHFTPELLGELERRGVQRCDVTLHVGPGTFKPITTDRVADHVMHGEHYTVETETLRTLREHQPRRRAGEGRVIAVGTTSVRTLESLPEVLPEPSTTISGRTDLLIAPPHAFRHVDGMLTNFHLPRSTLLALVAARIGLERMKTIYEEAVAEQYRFYSYGDAMLIV